MGECQYGFWDDGCGCQEYIDYYESLTLEQWVEELREMDKHAEESN